MPQPHGNVFLESRYRKLVRGLPQTTFFCPKCKGGRRRRKRCSNCDGHGRLFEDSVQDLLGRTLLPAFRSLVGKFHGAGREDLDVRMLGRGRPFVFEVVEPRRVDVDLLDVVTRFHARHGELVRIDALRTVEKSRVAELKEGEFAKLYRLEVDLALEVEVAALRALIGRTLQLSQRTPRRVAHRRSDLERIRTVVVADVASPSSDAERTLTCTIDLHCEHGTYVKEWVSGDDDRTTPSLASLLGVAATCRTLDVLEILDAPVDGHGGSDAAAEQARV